MIRRAEQKDIERCVELGHHFYKQTAYGQVPYCYESASITMNLSLDQGLFAVLEVDGIVEGFILGLMSPMIFNRNVNVGAELAWWVQPEYRKGRYGIDLLKFMEQLAQDEGVNIWSMMSLEAVEPEKIETIYKRMGYTKSENTFMRIF